MSFKTWSAAQDSAVKKRAADDKAKDAPAVAGPVAQPDKTLEKPSVQGPPMRKS